MLLTNVQSQALKGLCSEDRLQLMDSVDSLRSQGINHFVSLPQLIVCGDQSAGKSSVLEAISGVSFPINSSLCTRFPTELVLRRSSHVGINVSIVPHHSRPDAEKANLAAFQKELDGIDGFATLIEDAKAVLGISTHGRAFSNDLLRVEISGPDRPHLTIVDLPGLIHSETKHQAASDVELIQDVVRSYMAEPRSIILAVVSAKNDFPNQIVLKLARQVDPSGSRTLGIITKPDTLVPGSESETVYTSLARNQEVEFRLGWHVLKNMDCEIGKGSLTERDALETAFFKQGIWQHLPSADLGIGQLRSRLSKVLLGHITSELPGLVKEIEAKRASCCDELTRLGQPRVTLYDQQLYLVGVSQSFQRVVKDAVDANCTDQAFFENPETERGYQKRIRAVVQNLNTEFAQDLSERGHRHPIVGFLSDAAVSSSRDKGCMSREEFIDRIETKMRRSRGRELPGLFDPMIMADLFHEQASPWGDLVVQHVHRVWTACKTFLRHAVAHVSDGGTTTMLVREVLEPAMDTIFKDLQAKTAEVLLSHRTIHPISYNHYFTETVQKVRAADMRDRCASAVMKYFGVSDLESKKYEAMVDPSRLVDYLMKRTTEPDMNRFAASEALNYMEAYYKVAMKRFVDDVAVEIIEVCLVSKLGDVLSPVKIFQMTSELVNSIAGESEEKQTQRENLGRQLQILTAGAQTCRGFVGTGCYDQDASVDKEPHTQHFESDRSTNMAEEPSADDRPSEAAAATDVSVETPDIVCDPAPEEFVKPADELLDFGETSTPLKRKGKKVKKSSSWFVQGDIV